MFELDLKSSENLYLFSPKIDPVKTERLIQELKKLKLEKHVFILSSGSTSTGELKGYAIKKESLAANAEAVNRHLGLGPDDTWYLSLPQWHIGGLSVFARAKLAGAKVVQSESKWDPRNWVKEIEGCSVTSIVPLQAYDLVREKLRAPDSLKYVIVGGDLLSTELHGKLVELGWPVLRTFGMTEVCSQLATEKEVSEFPSLRVLDIHQVKIDEDSRLLVKSPALFSGMFKLGESFSYDSIEEDLMDGFFATSDLAKLENGNLVHLGRSDQAFKSKGRLFFFNELRNKVSNFALKNGLYSQIELRLVDDSRSGKKAKIIATPELQVRGEALLEHLRELLAPLPIEGIQFEEIRRTELGKVKR